MQVRKVNPQDLHQLSLLFDGYRQFYQQAPDVKGAYQFLKQRMDADESMVFVAEHNKQLLGFTQLYPSYSSVSMQRLWVLNDLFVIEQARQTGVAAALIEAAEHWAQITDSKGLVLETDSDNIKAQKLYAKLNLIKQVNTQHYFLPTQQINTDKLS